MPDPITAIACVVAPTPHPADLPEPATPLPSRPESAQKRTEAHSPAPPIQDQQSAIQSPPRLLSDRQLTAITLLVSGQSDSAVAATLGLSRGTVNRWRHHHPRFIAALNRRRQELADVTADRLRRMLLQAVHLLDQQLHAYHVDTRDHAARALLRFVGPAALLQPPGPTDEAHARQQLQDQRVDIDDSD